MDEIGIFIRKRNLILIIENPFMPSPHNNIKPPHAELSEFDIAELTFVTSCRREGLGGGWRSERPVGVGGWEKVDVGNVLSAWKG